ncbi:MAG: hypothetical protein GXP29_09530 [Planctomycetes bacterium]|nr:hypothetical protein [Planctomycetota bacterium]
MSNESSQSVVVAGAQSESQTAKPEARQQTTDQESIQSDHKIALSDCGIAQSEVHGSLDVMGGIAEYCGAMTLSTPTLDRAVVKVSRRDDQKIAISVTLCDTPASVCGESTPSASNGRNGFDDGSGSGCKPETVRRNELPLSIFYDDDGGLKSSSAILDMGVSEKPEVAGLAVVSLRALLAAKVVPHFSGGLALNIELGLTGDILRRQAALVVAVLRSTVAAFGVECPSRELAVIAQGVLAVGVGAQAGGYACGLATVTAPSIDRPGFLSSICCRPLEIGEPLPFPKGVTMMGIDSGVRHPKAIEKYRHARTTSMMGCEIVSRWAKSFSGDGSGWHGYLARVSVSEYVDRFRDCLPTKLKGAQYLDRFGPLADPFAVVSPNETYKIRSRTEHHIYEDDRVRLFVERLSHATRTGDSQAVIDAGKLMYASHWSYGQRCGLGCRETDALVGFLRKCKPEGGVFGARISGSGAGGTVVVLMRDSDETRMTIARAVREYEQASGFQATLQPASVLSA